MANAASNRRASKNILLGIKIRQTQLAGECKLIARKIAADEDSLGSISSQKQVKKVQKRIAKNKQALVLHERSTAALSSETFAAEEGRDLVVAM